MQNLVALVGEVGEYGCKLSYRENGQPECTVTCVVKEPSRQGDTIFRTFVPLVLYGALAEKAAVDLEPGMCIAVSGKLAWRATTRKPADGSKGEGNWSSWRATCRRYTRRPWRVPISCTTESNTYCVTVGA